MAKMTPMQIMNAIRKALEQDERSQRDIAKAAGVHHVNLSQFKSGKRDLPLDTLCDLAKVLGLAVKVVSVDERKLGVIERKNRK
jgi:transcriptional regulator with XRE-family HTH domain